MSFRKNKYQILSYTTSNMDDLKAICIYENIPISEYFFKLEHWKCSKVSLVYLKKNQRDIIIFFIFFFINVWV